jgi:hypothetical protein
MTLNPQIAYLGIDTSAEAVHQARRRNKHLSGCVFTASPCDAFERCIRLACCCEVIEHADDPVGFLKSFRWMMATGCRLVVTCPGGPMNEFYKAIGHRRHYDPDELADVVSRAGFRIVLKRGYGFPFFNIYRLLLALSGKRLLKMTEGKPNWFVKLHLKIFAFLFRFDLKRWGWQSVVLAEL